MKILSNNKLASLSDQAAASERLRRNLNLHESYDDPVQRLCNAMEPGTYVRPHRHVEPGKWELFIVLSGSLAVLSFSDEGEVTERVELGAAGPSRGIEIPPATWHTLVSLAPGTVAFEVKPGPYAPLRDKDFAAWAPGEGEPGARAFLDWMVRAVPGDRPPPSPPHE